MADGKGDLAARIALIEDRAAIQDLLYAVASAIDRYDGGVLARCIDPEAVIDMGGEAPISGAAFAAAIKPPANPRPGRMHVISNSRIRVEGDSAGAESQIVSWQDQLAGDARVTRVRAGRYLDRFARTGGEWRLVARTLVDEWARVDPVDAVPPQGRHLGQPAPADLLYQTLEGLI
ncbi:nuclear transport factor 2 family protein [Sphingobium sp.]|uniref:nuclear transport factor 2 family protein n=1 Tax=Sphingobium sp. TaxID=1912891 RepID=UPI0028BE2232|nr:nuclear transport factor 2 family protein [Sphingobium sp.]